MVISLDPQEGQFFLSSKKEIDPQQHESRIGFISKAWSRFFLPSHSFGVPATARNQISERFRADFGMPSGPAAAIAPELT